MFKRINKADLYIGLWCIFEVLGIIRMFDALSVLLLGVAFFIAIRYALIMNSSSENRYFQALNILLIMFTIYGFVYLVIGPTYDIGDGPVNKRTYLINIYKSLLPIYPLYYFSKKGLITEESLKKWVFFFILLCIITYFKREEEAIMALREKGFQREGITNNTGYLLLYLLPCLVVYDSKRWLQNTLLIIIMVFIFLAMKRGAILISVICASFLLLKQFTSFKYRTKILFLLFLILILGIAYDALITFYEQNAYFQERFADTIGGHTSGRDELSTSALTYYFDSAGIVKEIFGSGADATLGAIGNYAHNDWIEILINQGIVGVFVFLHFIIGIFYMWRKSKSKPEAYMAIGLYGCIFFCKTFFSMSYADVPIYATVIFSYYLSVSNKKTVKTKSLQ